MNRIQTLAAVAALALLPACFAGVAFTGRTGVGAIYANTSLGENVTANPPGSKRGEACSKSYFGLVTTGDATVATAARNGGITRVSTVDNRHENILGVYATYCAVVTGD